MEEFLKKHNFDINSKMKTRKFNIVRYFPKVDTYEFLNVGVVVYDGDELHYRLLSAKEISLLHCPILIESKVLKNSVEDLGDFLQGKYSSDEIILKINNRYKNVLDTSFQLSSKSEEPIDELVHKLFYQYVGYKLERAEKETTAQKFEQKTKEIVAREFKDKIEVKKSIVSGFSLDFYNKKSSKIVHSLIGSINNSQDVFRAFQGVPLHISSGTEYDFLNAVNNANVENKEKLLRNGIKVFNYTSDDEVFEYCKQVLN